MAESPAKSSSTRPPKNLKKIGDHWTAWEPPPAVGTKALLPAVIVRSGTAARLERDLPRQDLCVFQYYPHIIVSIDYAKFDRATIPQRNAYLPTQPERIVYLPAPTAAATPPVGQ